jgi:hypothetical protein
MNFDKLKSTGVGGRCVIVEVTAADESGEMKPQSLKVWRKRITIEKRLQSENALLQDAIELLSEVLVTWDVTDERGDRIPINRESLSALDVNDVLMPIYLTVFGIRAEKKE